MTITFDLSDSRTKKFLCTLNFEFIEDFSNGMPISGEIKIKLTLGDIWEFGGPKNYTYSWQQYEIDGYFELKIGDFKVPPSIAKRGVGPFIFHTIYNNLPGKLKDKIVIRGILSSVDKLVPALDERGNLIYIIKGSHRLRDNEMIENIQGRNSFWKSIVKPFPDKEDKYFICDEDGNGRFFGIFTDPWDTREQERPLYEIKE